MRNITEGMLDSERKSCVSPNVNKVKDTACRNCGKHGYTHKECRGDPTCFFCKEKGHRQFDCPTLRNRQGAQGPRRQQTVQVAAAVFKEAAEDSVALISEDESSRLKLSRPLMQVNSIYNNACELVALMDTGSPVSFINLDIYIKRGSSPLPRFSYRRSLFGQSK
ncbi:hypothetical protein P5V15_011684 [Pogonomyrmex californicus]